MHHRTELPFVDEFHWVSPLHYLKNGWQNAVLLWCMLQAGPPSLHYYCAVVLHSCIVLPPVSHTSNHQYHCCQLADNRAVIRIFIALLSFPSDSPLYKCENNPNSVYLTFIHCRRKFENYIQTFLSEIYNRIRHAHARNTSGDSIPPRSL